MFRDSLFGRVRKDLSVLNYGYGALLPSSPKYGMYSLHDSSIKKLTKTVGFIARMTMTL